MQGLEDVALVVRARHGDKKAFEILIERHQSVAERVARRMVNHPGVAVELTQEALLEAYLSLDSLRDPARFSSWLYGIVVNVCRSYLRVQKLKFQPLETYVGGQWIDVNPFLAMEPGPEQLIEAREMHQWVREAVQALSPANREAVMRFYYEELSLREAATVLGISIPALKVRLHRAREQLRLELSIGGSLVERSDAMIAVKFSNIVHVQIPGGPDVEAKRWNVMLLLDEEDKRVLPIWIGRHEAEALMSGVLGGRPDSKMKRPMTWNFVVKILEASGAVLEDVTISALRNNTFFATVRLNADGQLHEIDARPSDAIPLAMIMEKPLYASTEEIPAETWWDVPEDFDIEDSLLGVGMAGLSMEQILADPVPIALKRSFSDEKLEQFDDEMQQAYLNEQQEALRRYVFDPNE